MTSPQPENILARLIDEMRAAGKDVSHLVHHQPQPTFTPSVSSVPSPQEEHMSVGSELHKIATVAETFGENAIAIFTAVASNPETKAGVVLLARMAGLGLSDGMITTALGGLAVAENIYRTGRQAAQSAQAAQPQQVQQPAQQPSQTAQAAPAVM
jgi:hypothetical protein